MGPSTPNPNKPIDNHYQLINNTHNQQNVPIISTLSTIGIKKQEEQALKSSYIHTTKPKRAKKKQSIKKNTKK